MLICVVLLLPRGGEFVSFLWSKGGEFVVPLKKKKEIPGGWPGGCITEDAINKLFHFFVGFVGNQSQTHDAGDTNGQHQKLVVHVVSKCLCLYIYCVCVCLLLLCFACM